MKIFFAGIILTILTLFASFTKTENRISHRYVNEIGKIEFETKNDLYDGNYCSYYKNGNKKCEGQYLANQKTGLWTLYDSLGNGKVKRTYSNSFVYSEEFIFKNKNYFEGGSTLPNLMYNKSGYIDYEPIKINAIQISKRIWRHLTEEDCPTVFSNSRIMSSLVEAVLAKKITAFDLSSDELTDTISKQHLARLLDTSNYDLVGFQIKEDWFYDKERNLSETRIVTICPVVRPKSADSGGLQDYNLCWFYFPEIRSVFAKIKIQDRDQPKNIHSLDDLFFFRYFHAHIDKETNIFNRQLSDYCTSFEMVEKERERIEMSLFEMEENAWLSSFK